MDGALNEELIEIGISCQSIGLNKYAKEETTDSFRVLSVEEVRDYLLNIV
jgi:hypothetical protein